ncbi:MAG TPA: GMC oxidoreductase, partial [Chiayiivirga sp.]|nr:GMC oxidoreductase [Chiayiivirga sp.]
IHPEDTASALAFFDDFSAVLAQTGQGRTRLTYEATAARLASVNGANHHLGTVRFAHDPKDGVADADGRIHDMENLYVASSALFPRYGYSNPTLTIVALAIRLASRWAGESAEAGT